MDTTSAIDAAIKYRKLRNIQRAIDSKNAKIRSDYLDPIVHADRIEEKRIRDRDDAYEVDLIQRFRAGDHILRNIPKEEHHNLEIEEKLFHKSIKTIRDDPIMQSDYATKHIGKVNIPKLTTEQEKHVKDREIYLDTMNNRGSLFTEAEKLRLEIIRLNSSISHNSEIVGKIVKTVDIEKDQHPFDWQIKQFDIMRECQAKIAVDTEDINYMRERLGVLKAEILEKYPDLSADIPALQDVNKEELIDENEADKDNIFRDGGTVNGWIIGRITDDGKNDVVTLGFGKFTRDPTPPVSGYVYVGKNLDRDILDSSLYEERSIVKESNTPSKSKKATTVSNVLLNPLLHKLSEEEMLIAKNDKLTVEYAVERDQSTQGVYIKTVKEGSFLEMYIVSGCSIDEINGKYLIAGKSSHSVKYRNARGWTLFRFTLFEIPELGIFADTCYQALGDGPSMTEILDNRAAIANTELVSKTAGIVDGSVQFKRRFAEMSRAGTRVITLDQTAQLLRNNNLKAEMRNESDQAMILMLQAMNGAFREAVGEEKEGISNEAESPTEHSPTHDGIDDHESIGGSSLDSGGFENESGSGQRSRGSRGNMRKRKTKSVGSKVSSSEAAEENKSIDFEAAGVVSGVQLDIKVTLARNIEYQVGSQGFPLAKSNRYKFQEAELAAEVTKAIEAREAELSALRIESQIAQKKYMEAENLIAKLDVASLMAPLFLQMRAVREATINVTEVLGAWMRLVHIEREKAKKKPTIAERNDPRANRLYCVIIAVRGDKLYDQSPALKGNSKKFRRGPEPMKKATNIDIVGTYPSKEEAFLEFDKALSRVPSHKMVDNPFATDGSMMLVGLRNCGKHYLVRSPSVPSDLPCEECAVNDFAKPNSILPQIVETSLPQFIFRGKSYLEKMWDDQGFLKENILLTKVASNLPLSYNPLLLVTEDYRKILDSLNLQPENPLIHLKGFMEQLENAQLAGTLVRKPLTGHEMMGIAFSPQWTGDLDKTEKAILEKNKTDYIDFSKKDPISDSLNMSIAKIERGKDLVRSSSAPGFTTWSTLTPHNSYTDQMNVTLGPNLMIRSMTGEVDPFNWIDFKNQDKASKERLERAIAILGHSPSITKQKLDKDVVPDSVAAGPLKRRPLERTGGTTSHGPHHHEDTLNNETQEDEDEDDEDEDDHVIESTSKKNKNKKHFKSVYTEVVYTELGAQFATGQMRVPNAYRVDNVWCKTDHGEFQSLSKGRNLRSVEFQQHLLEEGKRKLAAREKLLHKLRKAMDIDIVNLPVAKIRKLMKRAQMLKGDVLLLAVDSAEKLLKYRVDVIHHSIKMQATWRGKVDRKKVSKIKATLFAAKIKRRLTIEKSVVLAKELTPSLIQKALQNVVKEEIKPMLSFVFSMSGIKTIASLYTVCRYTTRSMDACRACMTKSIRQRYDPIKRTSKPERSVCSCPMVRSIEKWRIYAVDPLSGAKIEKVISVDQMKDDLQSILKATPMMDPETRMKRLVGKSFGMLNALFDLKGVSFEGFLDKSPSYAALMAANESAVLPLIDKQFSDKLRSAITDKKLLDVKQLNQFFYKTTEGPITCTHIDKDYLEKARKPAWTWEPLEDLRYSRRRLNYVKHHLFVLETRLKDATEEYNTCCSISTNRRVEHLEWDSMTYEDARTTLIRTHDRFDHATKRINDAMTFSKKGLEKFVEEENHESEDWFQSHNDYQDGGAWQGLNNRRKLIIVLEQCVKTFKERWSNLLKSIQKLEDAEKNVQAAKIIREKCAIDVETYSPTIDFATNITNKVKDLTLEAVRKTIKTYALPRKGYKSSRRMQHISYNLVFFRDALERARKEYRGAWTFLDRRVMALRPFRNLGLDKGVLRCVVEIFMDPTTGFYIVHVEQEELPMEESVQHTDFHLVKSDFSDLTSHALENDILLRPGDLSRLLSRHPRWPAEHLEVEQTKFKNKSLELKVIAAKAEADADAASREAELKAKEQNLSSKKEVVKTNKKSNRRTLAPSASKAHTLTSKRSASTMIQKGLGSPPTSPPTSPLKALDLTTSTKTESTISTVNIDIQEITTSSNTELDDIEKGILEENNDGKKHTKAFDERDVWAGFILPSLRLRSLNGVTIYKSKEDKFKDLPFTYLLRRKKPQDLEASNAKRLFEYLRLQPHTGRPCLGLIHFLRRIAYSSKQVMKCHWFRDLIRQNPIPWTNEISRHLVRNYRETAIAYTRICLDHIQINLQNIFDGVDLGIVVNLRNIMNSLSHNPVLLSVFLCEIVLNKFSYDTINYFINRIDKQLTGETSDIDYRKYFYRKPFRNEFPRLGYLQDVDSKFRGPVYCTYKFMVGFYFKISFFLSATDDIRMVLSAPNDGNFWSHRYDGNDINIYLYQDEIRAYVLKACCIETLIPHKKFLNNVDILHVNNLEYLFTLLTDTIILADELTAKEDEFAVVKKKKGKSKKGKNITVLYSKVEKLIQQFNYWTKGKDGKISPIPQSTMDSMLNRLVPDVSNKADWTLQLEKDDPRRKYVELREGMWTANDLEKYSGFRRLGQSYSKQQFMMAGPSGAPSQSFVESEPPLETVGQNFDSYWKIRFLTNEQKSDFFIELKSSDVNNKRVQRYLAVQESVAMGKEDADSAMTEKKLHLQELQHDLENRLIQLTNEYSILFPKLGKVQDRIKAANNMMNSAKDKVMRESERWFRQTQVDNFTKLKKRLSISNSKKNLHDSSNEISPIITYQYEYPTNHDIVSKIFNDIVDDIISNNIDKDNDVDLRNLSDAQKILLERHELPLTLSSVLEWINTITNRISNDKVDIDPYCHNVTFINCTKNDTKFHKPPKRFIVAKKGSGNFTSRDYPRYSNFNGVLDTGAGVTSGFRDIRSFSRNNFFRPNYDPNPDANPYRQQESSLVLNVNGRLLIVSEPFYGPYDITRTKIYDPFSLSSWSLTVGSQREFPSIWTIDSANNSNLAEASSSKKETKSLEYAVAERVVWMTTLAGVVSAANRIIVSQLEEQNEQVEIQVSEVMEEMTFIRERINILVTIKVPGNTNDDMAVDENDEENDQDIFDDLISLVSEASSLEMSKSIAQEVNDNFNDDILVYNDHDVSSSLLSSKELLSSPISLRGFSLINVWTRETFLATSSLTSLKYPGTGILMIGLFLPADEAGVALPIITSASNWLPLCKALLGDQKLMRLSTLSSVIYICQQSSSHATSLKHVNYNHLSNSRLNRWNSEYKEHLGWRSSNEMASKDYNHDLIFPDASRKKYHNLKGDAVLLLKSRSDLDLITEWMQKRYVEYDAVRTLRRKKEGREREWRMDNHRIFRKKVFHQASRFMHGFIHIHDYKTSEKLILSDHDYIPYYSRVLISQYMDLREIHDSSNDSNTNIDDLLFSPSLDEAFLIDYDVAYTDENLIRFDDEMPEDNTGFLTDVVPMLKRRVEIMEDGSKVITGKTHDLQPRPGQLIYAIYQLHCYSCVKSTHLCKFPGCNSIRSNADVLIRSKLEAEDGDIIMNELKSLVGTGRHPLELSIKTFLLTNSEIMSRNLRSIYYKDATGLSVEDEIKNENKIDDEEVARLKELEYLRLDYPFITDEARRLRYINRRLVRPEVSLSITADELINASGEHSVAEDEALLPEDWYDNEAYPIINPYTRDYKKVKIENDLNESSVDTLEANDSLAELVQVPKELILYMLGFEKGTDGKGFMVPYWAIDPYPAYRELDEMSFDDAIAAQQELEDAHMPMSKIMFDWMLKHLQVSRPRRLISKTSGDRGQLVKENVALKLDRLHCEGVRVLTDGSIITLQILHGKFHTSTLCSDKISSVAPGAIRFCPIHLIPLMKHGITLLVFDKKSCVSVALGIDQMKLSRISNALNIPLQDVPSIARKILEYSGVIVKLSRVGMTCTGVTLDLSKIGVRATPTVPTAREPRKVMMGRRNGVIDRRILKFKEYSKLYSNSNDDDDDQDDDDDTIIDPFKHRKTLKGLTKTAFGLGMFRSKPVTPVTNTNNNDDINDNNDDYIIKNDDDDIDNGKNNSIVSIDDTNINNINNNNNNDNNNNDNQNNDNDNNNNDDNKKKRIGFKAVAKSMSLFRK